jgi:hypothetical protein
VPGALPFGDRGAVGEVVDTLRHRAGARSIALCQ